MTAQERAEIKQLKQGQTLLLKAQEEMSKDNLAFRKEVRGDIKEIKALLHEIPNDYIPKSDVDKTIKFMRWFIATLIAIAGVIVLWIHK